MDFFEPAGTGVAFRAMNTVSGFRGVTGCFAFSTPANEMATGADSKDPAGLLSFMDASEPAGTGVAFRAMNMVSGFRGVTGCFAFSTPGNDMVGSKL
jgi:hypothetical protein